MIVSIIVVAIIAAIGFGVSLYIYFTNSNDASSADPDIPEAPPVEPLLMGSVAGKSSSVPWWLIGMDAGIVLLVFVISECILVIFALLPIKFVAFHRFSLMSTN